MTLKELARLANVSVSTVLQEYNGKDGTASSETREKILRLVRETTIYPILQLGV